MLHPTSNIHNDIFQSANMCWKHSSTAFFMFADDFILSTEHFSAHFDPLFLFRFSIFQYFKSAATIADPDVDAEMLMMMMILVTSAEIYI